MLIIIHHPKKLKTNQIKNKTIRIKQPKIMRRILFLTALLAFCFAGQAQKQKKPNINKAEALRVKGELAEAKEIIDYATEYEKTKENGKTWYYRALIYATIDTTSNPAIAALSENALEVSMESFGKAIEFGDPKNAYYTAGTFGIATQDQQVEGYFNYYFNNAIKSFENNEFQAAIDEFYNAAVIFPEDSNVYKNAAYAAHNGQLWDQAISGYKLTIEKGAKSKDMFTNLITIYQSVKKDNESALEIARQSREVYPNDSDLAKSEINLLIQLDRIEEARSNLIQAIEEDPENTNLLFTLAAMYEELDNEPEALKTYRRAIEIDPNHFESNFNVGVIMLNNANEIYKEYTDLGISKEDQKKADALEPKIEESYKAALPQWEKLWELKSDDRQVGETLAYLYARLRRYDDVEKVQSAIDELPSAEE